MYVYTKGKAGWGAKTIETWEMSSIVNELSNLNREAEKPNWSLKANRVPLIILSERLLASIVSSLTEPKFHLATFLLKYRYFYNQQRRSYCIQLSNLTSERIISQLLAELRVLQKIVKLSFCLKMICPHVTNDIISCSQSNSPSFWLKINCKKLLGVARTPLPLYVGHFRMIKG